MMTDDGMNGREATRTCCMPYGAYGDVTRVTRQLANDELEKLLISWLIQARRELDSVLPNSTVGLVLNLNALQMWYIRRIRLRWLGHVDRVDSDDWVSACS